MVQGIKQHTQSFSVAWWESSTGGLTEWSEPNTALHLTASSVRSGVAPASGGR